MIAREKTIKGWHFLPQNKRLGYGDGRVVRAGCAYKMRGKTPMLYWAGMHASQRLLDALRLASGPIACRVEVWGDLKIDDKRICGTHRRVIWMVDATDVLHRFACRVAKNALTKNNITDERCWRAINTKLKWLKGEATDADLDAAQDAALDAALDATRYAAIAVVLAATDVAARAAATSAARYAAWATARTKQNRTLTSMICAEHRRLLRAGGAA